MDSRVSPAAKRPSSRATGKRMPRMHGLPVQTAGSIVMRSWTMAASYPKMVERATSWRSGPPSAQRLDQIAAGAEVDGRAREILAHCLNTAAEMLRQEGLDDGR